jgi:hypothetical protein
LGAATTTPGDYNFQWTLFQLGVEWLGQATENALVSVR